RGAVALPAAHRLVFRQLVGHPHGVVVQAAHHDRLIGVAAEERDEHLLADARDRDHAEPAAGPALAHAHPARALVAVVCVPIPGEVHADASKLVRVDLLALGTDHDRTLHAVDLGL